MTLADELRRRFEASAYRDSLPAQDDVRFTGEFTAAAVLAAVIDRPEPTLLLTRRRDDLRHHPGQIAFPGGRADPSDADPIATALREAEEEVALPPAAVTVIGTDRPYLIGTGFAVVPVLGVIPPDLPLRPCAAEVAEIFEVPLAYVINAANHIPHEAEFRGRLRRFIEIPYENYHIWGATAAMIAHLGHRLSDG